MKKNLLLVCSVLIMITIMIALITPFYVSAQSAVAIISDLDWNGSGSQIAVGISAPDNESRCVTSPNIQILDIASQQVTNIPQVDRACSVTNVDFSPDGSQLLTTSDSYLAIWNVVNGQLIQSLTMSAVFQHAFWSPDGLALLDVRSTGVDIRNPTNLAESYRALIAPGRLENKFFTYSVWSPDDNSVASSTSDGKIYVWDAATKNVLIIFSAHTAPVQRLVWNTALNLIASGDDSGEILVWNPSTGTTVSELDGHAGAIRDLDWRSDGQQLVSASDDNTVRTWAWPSGQMNMVENGQSVWSVAYSPDGSQLAYAGDVTDPQNIAAQIVVTSSISSTPTATFTPTATDTPTNTPTSTFASINTATYTPTATSTVYTFPSTGVLDNFNRANGTIGSNWTGTTGNYSINSNQLQVGNDGDIYWNGATFGADQEVGITLASINTSASEIDLLLKVQGSSWTSGTIEVVYNPSANVAQVWTYTSSQDWVQRGTDLPVTFVAGDVFGARAKFDGTVEVYKNSTLLGSRDISAWPYYTNGGKIGLWTVGANSSILDDFRGGNFGTAAVTPTATSVSTTTLTPGVTNTPANFPTTGVVDTFNRANGAIGSNWAGTTSGYSIVSNHLQVNDGETIYWDGATFGANQEAYVTLNTLNMSADEIDLLLKGQGNYWGDGILEIWYRPTLGVIQVMTYEISHGWVQHGADISVTFAAGDRFGARAKVDGTVEVYQNNTLLGTRDITAWTYYANGGTIGLWMINASGTIVDDFGGGNS